MLKIREGGKRTEALCGRSSVELGHYEGVHGLDHNLANLSIFPQVENFISKKLPIVNSSSNMFRISKGQGRVRFPELPTLANGMVDRFDRIGLKENIRGERKNG